MPRRSRVKNRLQRVWNPRPVLRLTHNILPLVSRSLTDTQICRTSSGFLVCTCVSVWARACEHAGRGSPFPSTPEVFLLSSGLHRQAQVPMDGILRTKVSCWVEGVDHGVQSMLQTPITVFTLYHNLTPKRCPIFLGDWLQILFIFFFNTFIYWWGDNLFSYWKINRLTQ